MELNLPEITKTYLLANTPAYPYKHLRREQTLLDFAQQSSPQFLANIIREVDASDTRDPQTVARAYAAAVALTYHDPSEVRTLFAIGEIRNLHWIPDILNLWFDSLIVTNLRTVRLAPTQIESRSRIQAANSTGIIESGESPL